MRKPPSPSRSSWRQHLPGKNQPFRNDRLISIGRECLIELGSRYAADVPPLTPPHVADACIDAKLCPCCRPLLAAAEGSTRRSQPASPADEAGRTPRVVLRAARCWTDCGATDGRTRGHGGSSNGFAAGFFVTVENWRYSRYITLENERCIIFLPVAQRGYLRQAIRRPRISRSLYKYESTC
jgi:hypothetical protein